jgi:hypothetical protein
VVVENYWIWYPVEMNRWCVFVREFDHTNKMLPCS